SAHPPTFTASRITTITSAVTLKSALPRKHHPQTTTTTPMILRPAVVRRSCSVNADAAREAAPEAVHQPSQRLLLRSSNTFYALPYALNLEAVLTQPAVPPNGPRLARAPNPAPATAVTQPPTSA